MSRTLFSMPIATAVLAGLLAGCGGGDTLTLDTAAPTLSSVQTAHETVVKQARLTVTGTVTDDTGVQSVQIALNGQTGTAALSGGSFTATVDLKAGRNNYTLTARDAAGNEGTLQGSVYLGHRVAGGNAHAGALIDGKLYTWGRNNFGQTGLGFTSTVSANAETHPVAPTRAGGTATFVALAFNQNHSLAIDANGQVWSWGDDTDGQLGRGTDGRSLCGSGTVANCRLDIAQVPGLDNTVSLSAGYNHVLALKADGTVWAMGLNTLGQLGNGTTTRSATPVPVVWSPADAPNVGRIVQVSASSASSYALDDQGQLWAWGRNQYANLGQGALSTGTTAQATPLKVPMPAGVRIASVANGRDHVLALSSDGKVYAWGLNASSQVGFNGYIHKGTATAWASPVLSPTSLPWMETHPVVEVYGNGNTSYARRADGKVYPWGMYGASEGTGTVYANLDEPEDRLTTLASIVDMSLGALHQVALRSDGQVFTWGWSFEGALGGGSTTINTWMYNAPLNPVFP
ncbi:MAG: Ig-like domain-containing protein [Hydrogenophaga sp.]|nr:Ig-like domain-containing protein [Hydrogenophaga sp.]